MRVTSFGSRVAIAGVLTVLLAPPSMAGALSDLVGFGSQNVFIEPPAQAPAAGNNSGIEKPSQKVGKTKQIRLSKDCVEAGLKTRADCDAFHAAQAKKPTESASTPKNQGGTVTSVDTTPPAASGQPAGAATAQPPAATGNGAPTEVVVMPTATGTQSSTTTSAITTNQDGAPSTNCGSGSTSTLGVLTNINPPC
jgi:hypothetical protein